MKGVEMGLLDRREFMKKMGIVVGSIMVTAKMLPSVAKPEDRFNNKGMFNVPVKVTVLGIKDNKTGKIHPLKMFDRVLTDGEIEKLYDMTLREIADL